MDGTIAPDAYLRLLDWQARAHALLEPVVLSQRWEGYTYQSRMSALPDIASDGKTSAGKREASFPEDPLFALGVAYVLEGGSLGGSLIHKKLLANQGLKMYRPFSFYERQARLGVMQWRSYLKYLATTTFTTQEIERITEGGQAAFAVFRDCWLAEDPVNKKPR